jgi:hypothetical protein
MLVKVTSKIKLSIELNDGTKMISDEDVDKEEVHFLLFESTVNRFDLNWRIIGQVFRTFRASNLKFGTWYISDVDNWLNGNPLCDNDPWSMDDE